LILLFLDVSYIGAFAQQGTSIEERVTRLERRVKQLEVLVKRLASESLKPNEKVDPVESN
jgi:archaellum component FlaC